MRTQLIYLLDYICWMDHRQTYWDNYRLGYDLLLYILHPHRRYQYRDLDTFD